MKFRKGRHCISNLHAHLVFVTKYRFSVIELYMHKDLKTISVSYFAGSCEGAPIETVRKYIENKQK